MGMMDETGQIKRSYRKWSGMIRRCYSPKSHIYKYYGGRGITVCAKWMVTGLGYENFVKDMGEPPVGMTLERINNDGNYDPGNCRWATHAEQTKNRRARGPVEGSLRNRCKLVGMPFQQVYQRIRRGWTEELALSTPIGNRGRSVGSRIGVPRNQSLLVPNPPLKTTKQII